MFGSIITRAATLLLGYLYPAYDCFKSLERGRPQMDELRFWCQYWIIIATITVCERVADPFISWAPFYSEAKLAFIIYLWHPSTKGTNYIYNQVVVPLVARHEPEIDRHLAELHTRSGDVVFHYCQVALRNGQGWVLEVLRYVASQAPHNRIEGAEAVPQAPPPVPPAQRAYDDNIVWGGDDIWQDPRNPPRYRVVVQEEDEFDDFDVVDAIPEPQRQPLAPLATEQSNKKRGSASVSATNPPLKEPSRGLESHSFPNSPGPDALPNSYPASAAASADEYVSKLRSRVKTQKPRSTTRSGKGSGSGSGSGAGGGGNWGSDSWGI